MTINEMMERARLTAMNTNYSRSQSLAVSNTVPIQIIQQLSLQLQYELSKHVR
jgi:hypothetical protein